MRVGDTRLIHKSRSKGACVIDTDLMGTPWDINETALSESLSGIERAVADTNPGE